MLLNILKSKLHRAVITMADVDYMGSIAIDSELMEAVGLRPYEQVHVWDVTNGARFITYAIEEKAGSGEICVNGAAAKLVSKGDLIIIASFAQVDEEEMKTWSPRIALVNSHNKVERYLKQ